MFNSSLNVISGILGSNAGITAKYSYNTSICEIQIEGTTSEIFPNWGGYRLGILPENARPKYVVVEYLYKSFYLEINTNGIVDIKVSDSMEAGIKLYGSKMFAIK